MGLLYSSHIYTVGRFAELRPAAVGTPLRHGPDEDIRCPTYRLSKFSHKWSESAAVSMAYNPPPFPSDDWLADAYRRSIGCIMCVGIEWHPS